LVTSSADIAHELRSANGKRAGGRREPVLAVLWSQAGARQTVILAALLMVVLAALVLPPFLFLLKASVVDAQRGGEWSLANFEAVLGSRHFLESSANSILFAAASAAVALAIGWISAWIVERTNSPLKPLAYLTAVVSLGTPYILYVTAWLLLLGKVGPVNQLYRTLTGTPDVLINVYSMPAWSRSRVSYGRRWPFCWWARVCATPIPSWRRPRA
jgi:ABC-type spermidine/putrescine transport system permease subunit I